MNRFQLVADHQRRHGVKRLCRVIGVARSSYYHWRATAPDRATRAAADARLAARIRVVHRDSAGTYGVPRITAELRETGHVVNHKRVARVMRQIGLAWPGCDSAAGTAPPSATPPRSKRRTCSAGTSPRGHRTPATSATSRIYRSPTARSAISRP